MSACPCLYARSILDDMPLGVIAEVMAGTNTADLGSYINQTLARGGVIDTLGFKYLTSGLVISVAGTQLVGGGTFVLTPGAASGSVHLTIEASMVSIARGITFDGGSQSASILYGIVNNQSIDRVRIDCSVQNYSFVGISVNDNNGGWTNGEVWVGASVRNVGWVGIEGWGCSKIDLSGSSVERTGYHCYDIERNSTVVGSNLYATKATPPYIIFNGPGGVGGVEAGSFFYRFQNARLSVVGFLFENNLNATLDSDGIMLGEGNWSIPDPESDHWFGTIRDAYGASFDATSGSSGEIVIECAPGKTGILMTKDRGGLTQNIDLKALVIGAGEGVSFQTPVLYSLNISTTSGSPNVTFAGSAVQNLVQGQTVSSASVPINATILSINPSTGAATLSANATSSTTTSCQVKGVQTWTNVNLEISTGGSVSVGVTINDGADRYAQYNNVNIKGDISSSTTDIFLYPSSNSPSGVVVYAKRNTYTSAVSQGWQTYIPNLTCTSGVAPTTASGITARYTIDANKRVNLQIAFGITNAGSPSPGAIVDFNLPVTASASSVFQVGALECLSGDNAPRFCVAAGTVVRMYKAGGADPGLTVQPFYVLGIQYEAL